MAMFLERWQDGTAVVLRDRVHKVRLYFFSPEILFREHVFHALFFFPEDEKHVHLLNSEVLEHGLHGLLVYCF
jgi:hypothetical protein